MKIRGKLGLTEEAGTDIHKLGSEVQGQQAAARLLAPTTGKTEQLKLYLKDYDEI